MVFACQGIMTKLASEKRKKGRPLVSPRRLGKLCVSGKDIVHNSHGELFLMKQNLRFGLVLGWPAQRKISTILQKYCSTFEGGVFILSWAKQN